MPTTSMIEKCIKAAMKISHRGPDDMRIEVVPRINAVLCFFRLAINDTTSLGNQPFIVHNEGKEYYLLCNGEIYNHKDLEQGEMKSRSDCEVIIQEMIKTDMNVPLNSLNSEHSFVGICINEDNSYKLVVSTDRFSIRPLFYSEFDGGFGFSSELQGLFPFRNFRIERVNSATEIRIINGSRQERKYWNLREVVDNSIFSFEENVTRAREFLTEAVKKRLMSDRKIGFFLSGGLDSTCVCICAKILGYELNTFSIGFKGSDDEIYAKRVAKELGAKHTHFTLKKSRYLKVLKEIVKTTGSFDTTTIRASVGQYECSRLARKKGFIVMISGDGSDELHFSYDDAFHCPDPESFKERTFHLLENIHTSDGLRADRCTSRFGMEIRLPFLDIDYVNFILSLPVEQRLPVNGVSKRLLREAFKGYVSDDIINRPKVTFSDGVGSKEDQTRTLLADFFADKYTQEEFEELKTKYEYHCPPTTNEELYYREIFAKTFLNNESVAKTIPHFWRPVFKKSSDPSAWFTSNYGET